MGVYRQWRDPELGGNEGCGCWHARCGEMLYHRDPQIQRAPSSHAAGRRLIQQDQLCIRYKVVWDVHDHIVGKPRGLLCCPRCVPAAQNVSSWWICPDATQTDGVIMPQPRQCVRWGLGGAVVMHELGRQLRPAREGSDAFYLDRTQSLTAGRTERHIFSLSKRMQTRLASFATLSRKQLIT